MIIKIPSIFILIKFKQNVWCIHYIKIIYHHEFYPNDLKRDTYLNNIKYKFNIYSLNINNGNLKQLAIYEDLLNVYIKIKGHIKIIIDNNIFKDKIQARLFNNILCNLSVKITP